ncbi:MAG: molecular chaperone TorD family protein [Betaproteobacteria bacterium]|nr:molecular chaperone TorD family protein [Betaproteobacteria bacterium]
MSADPHAGTEAIPEEEQARADMYAVLGCLFHAAPDESLLAELRPPESNAITGVEDDVTRAWRRLARAAVDAQVSGLRDEFEELFGGVGRALVTPYTSHYVAGTAPDKQVVALREALAELGLVRREMVFEVEDHIAAICDVMRLLVERNQSLDVQKAFFSRFVLPGAMPLCDAIDRIERAVFYRDVAALARAFLELERAAFDMVES